MPTTTPTLSIVIVSFNARAHLEACLQSLRRRPPAIPHEIVVVDNASTDGSVAAVRARWPHVTRRRAAHERRVRRRQQRRHPRGDGELILLLNSDTIVPPGALDRLVATPRRRTRPPPSRARGWSMPTASRSCRSAR